MKWIDKFAWIAINNQSVLSSKSFGKDKYYIPRGKRKNGESDEEALCREIKEAPGIDLKMGTLKLVGVFEAHAPGHPPDTFVKMTCYTADYTGTLNANLFSMTVSLDAKLSTANIICKVYLAGGILFSNSLCATLLLWCILT